MSAPAIALALPLIKRFEGCRLEPYQDAAAFWTIGWGCTRLPDGSRVTGHTAPLTQAGADGTLLLLLAAMADRVDSILPGETPVCQRAALYSFAWNLGVEALRRSTLLKLLKEGDVEGASEEFAKWIRAGGKPVRGLALRREAEKQVFLGKEEAA